MTDDFAGLDTLHFEGGRREAETHANGESDSMSTTVNLTTNEDELHLVLGVLSAPAHASRRAWMRNYIQWPPRLRVAMRFVVGTRRRWQGCAAHAHEATCRSLPPTDDDHNKEEAHAHGDMVLLDVEDGPRNRTDAWHSHSLGSFPTKSLAWYAYALRTYPRALWFAKIDDDSWVSVPGVEALLQQLSTLHEASEQFILAGWIQYASLLRTADEPTTVCGWSPVARDAAVGALHSDSNCHRSIDTPSIVELSGPYPFAAGPFELFSSALARHVFLSASTDAFALSLSARFDRIEAARRRRSPTGEDQRLAHGEDAIIGHVRVSSRATTLDREPHPPSTIGWCASSLALHSTSVPLTREVGSRLFAGGPRAGA